MWIVMFCLGFWSWDQLPSAVGSRISPKSFVFVVVIVLFVCRVR